MIKFFFILRNRHKLIKSIENGILMATPRVNELVRIDDAIYVVKEILWDIGTTRDECLVTFYVEWYD